VAGEEEEEEEEEEAEEEGQEPRQEGLMMTKARLASGTRWTGQKTQTWIAQNPGLALAR